jgi:hypothetical protein
VAAWQENAAPWEKIVALAAGQPGEPDMAHEHSLEDEDLSQRGSPNDAPTSHVRMHADGMFTYPNSCVDNLKPPCNILDHGSDLISVRCGDNIGRHH